MLLKDYPVVLPDYILTLEELSPESCLFFAGGCVIAQSFPHQPADNIGYLLPHITQMYH